MFSTFIFPYVRCRMISSSISTLHRAHYVWHLAAVGLLLQVEGLNIPMSVGPPWVDKDKTGEECIVYDVIINTKVPPVHLCQIL